MQLNASEISDLIKKEIEGFDFSAEARTEGTVISVSDGIVRIHGLADAQFGEMLEFPGNTFGLALNLRARLSGCGCFRRLSSYFRRRHSKVYKPNYGSASRK